MTVTIRPKDLTSSIPFRVDRESLNLTMFGMRKSTHYNDDARGQFDGYHDLSLGHSKSGDASSLEGDCPSPRVTRALSSGPVLPPLHPQIQSSLHSQPFSRRCRTLSSDTMASAGSSVVSIDAGKHGFITHDDASATGSLVLGYEQGKEVPPAEYDLPKAILGIDEEVRRAVYSVESKEEFHKLPYQIRSRLSLTHNTDNHDSPPDNRRWSNIPDLTMNIGYGAMEEGLMDIRDRVKANSNFPSPENGSTAANTMCYSIETSPFFENRANMYHQIPHCPVPEQLHMPSTWMSEEHLPNMEKRKDTSNNQTNVYLSMILVLVLFVGMIYGLFAVTKVVA
ncbi:hypothetical protein ACHAXN_013007 [Cyclotella atomus]